MIPNKEKSRRVRFSVFLKLFLVQLGMSLLVYLVVVLTLSVLLGSRLRVPIEKNIRNYAHLLVNRLGTPPDRNIAEMLAEEYKIEIRFESHGGAWSTSDTLPKIEEIEEHLLGHGIIQASFWQQFYVVRIPDGSAFLFRWNFGCVFK